MDHLISANKIKIVILSVLLGFFSSCQSSVEEQEQQGADLWGYWKPELVYLQSEPYSSLYVEVDALEGNEPSEKELEEIREIVREYCDKPDGIFVERSDVISLEKVKGLITDHIAGTYIDGLPDIYDQGHTAYLYVLYYDGSALGDVAHENPYVNRSYPAAIFINKDFFYGIWDFLSSYNIMKHEFGHVLGLAGDDRTHCNRQGCLMRKTLLYTPWEVISALFRPDKREYCRSCKEALATAKVGESKVRFLGPALVRSTEKYHILKLPSYVAIIFGSKEDLDQISWKDFIVEANENASSLKEIDMFHTHLISLEGLVDDLLPGMVKQLKQDPDPQVVEAAHLFEQRALR